jgi:transposase
VVARACAVVVLGTLVRRAWVRRLAAGAPAAVVWDGHGSHTIRLRADLPLACIRLPPYSPELNPAECVFEEIRRHTDGRICDTLADKQARADAYVAQLATGPARVRQLCAWRRLTAALDVLPIAS